MAKKLKIESRSGKFPQRAQTMRRMSLSSLLLASTAAAACLPGIQPRARMEQRGNVAGVRHGSVRKLGSRFSFVGKPRVGLQCRGTVSPGDLVLVTGSTGGVGQLVVANLVQKGYRVRAVTRSAEKGRELFGEADNLEIVEADQRYAETLSSIMDGVDGVVSCSGTTAFPSKRWDGNNGPQMTDQVGLQNLIDSAKTKGQDLKRFVLVSSTGVVRRKQFPFAIMNAFGVLDYKKESEEYLESSGIPYTILRPGRLTDGPYTSYDLNTLLKATSGSRKNIEMNAEDVLNGEMSRVTLAEAVVQAMQLDCTEGGVLSMMSREGEGPGSDTSEWEKRYKNTLA